MAVRGTLRPLDFEARKIRCHERVGKSIAKARGARGLRRADLARLAFMSDNALGNIERGTTACPLFTLECIAEALGCSIAELCE